MSKLFLKRVLILFFSSIILSITSFVLTFFNQKEIYPFFYWRLYSQPLGSKLNFKDYRLYGVRDKDTTRLPNKGYPYLNQDDYYYFLTNHIDIKNNKQKYSKKIHSFGKLINPNFDYYLIGEEFITLEERGKSNQETVTFIFSTKND